MSEKQKRDSIYFETKYILEPSTFKTLSFIMLVMQAIALVVYIVAPNINLAMHAMAGQCVAGGLFWIYWFRQTTPTASVRSVVCTRQKVAYKKLDWRMFQVAHAAILLTIALVCGNQKALHAEAGVFALPLIFLVQNFILFLNVWYFISHIDKVAKKTIALKHNVLRVFLYLILTARSK